MERTHSRWRKTLGLVLGASLLSISAASAAELTVWCWDPNFNIPAMQDAGARYTKDHPDTTFNINNISQDEINQKLQTQLLAGVTDGLWGITASAGRAFFLAPGRARLLGRLSGLALIGGGVWLSLARRPG